MIPEQNIQQAVDHNLHSKYQYFLFIIIFFAFISHQVLQLEQVQDQVTELSVTIMKVRSVGSYNTGPKDRVESHDYLGYLGRTFKASLSCKESVDLSLHI